MAEEIEHDSGGSTEALLGPDLGWVDDFPDAPKIAALATGPLSSEFTLEDIVQNLGIECSSSGSVRSLIDIATKHLDALAAAMDELEGERARHALDQFAAIVNAIVMRERRAVLRLIDDGEMVRWAQGPGGIGFYASPRQLRAGVTMVDRVCGELARAHDDYRNLVAGLSDEKCAMQAAVKALKEIDDVNSKLSHWSDEMARSAVAIENLRLETNASVSARQSPDGEGNGGGTPGPGSGARPAGAADPTQLSRRLGVEDSGPTPMDCEDVAEQLESLPDFGRIAPLLGECRSRKRTLEALAQDRGATERARGSSVNTMWLPATDAAVELESAVHDGAVEEAGVALARLARLVTTIMERERNASRQLLGDGQPGWARVMRPSDRHFRSGNQRSLDLLGRTCRDIKSAHASYSRLVAGLAAVGCDMGVATECLAEIDRVDATLRDLAVQIVRSESATDSRREGRTEEARDRRRRGRRV